MMAGKSPIWPGRFMHVIDERDRARDTAVRLEQELVALSKWATLLTHDLTRMHDEGAVDLEDWPAAKALVAHVNGWDPLSCQ